jgi:hypothetical protein
MKLLLDECVDSRLAKEFSGVEVKTVFQLNWAGIKNGALLTLAAKDLTYLSRSIKTCLFNKICRSSMLP